MTIQPLGNRNHEELVSEVERLEAELARSLQVEEDLREGMRRASGHMDKLAALVRTLVGALEAVEWVRYRARSSDYTCPSCYATIGRWHKALCKIEPALRAAEEAGFKPGAG